ncbi:MAG: hypothetical protein A3A33_05235 [Candidatus Yanofskybacteria bacterium RIFCSPLOWO2_01_FULL_49_25]|uniref:(d)CMP kinase n=1 Tax=Candidatus Yanofskybacteria bacterium RIFCSPLOWO2_01_FULL_49_25 TaxID=1802701 RepID=A0A1F8GYS3_9BACT|nr:MAG: hypothetical protein A3A33_05235 [Candidatus Yanofskybacteria bacterium RIFCSPLOWO2_01_FULL_49_25]
MKYAFISGIPASGKSYLAAKVAKEVGIQHFTIDYWWEEMKGDPKLKQWVDFFWNQNEAEYWHATNCERQWENIKNQSEALWPAVLLKIKEIQKSNKGAVFEGVSILPHLARRDLGFSGIILLGESFEAILERNKRAPRWGKTEELVQKQAEVFWNCEGSKYKSEAENYGYKTFYNADVAETELLKLLSE